MIEGFQIDVKSAEVESLLRRRVVYHERRSKEYVEALTGPLLGATGDSGNPREGLRRKVKEHDDRALLFQFMAEHVIPAETYRLSEQDLIRLELIATHF